MFNKFKAYIITAATAFVLGFLFNVAIGAYQANIAMAQASELKKQNKELVLDILKKDVEIKDTKEEITKLKESNKSKEDKLNKALSEIHSLKNEVLIERTKTQEELIVKVKTLYNSEEISAIDVSNLKVSESLMVDIVYDAENWKVNGPILIDKCKKYNEALNQSLEISKEKDKIILKQDDVIKLCDDQTSKYKIIINNKDIENVALIKSLKNEKINGNLKLIGGAIGGGTLVWLIILL